MKYIVFVGDGMADFPLPELGNRTPLQVARTPEMDRIARLGQCGTFVTVEDGMPPGSEVANLTILGYDPRLCHQGRGVIEAASIGIELEPSDLALRCNLICIEAGLIKNHSAGHIPTPEARELISFLNNEIGTDEIRLYPGISYRHILVLKHGSAAIECHPPHDHAGERAANLMIRALEPDASSTASLLNDLVRRSWQLLPNHPINLRRAQEGKDQANSIWPWSPGHKPRMATFQELHGLTGAVISAVDLIQGLGIYAGLDVIRVPGATGLIDTNFEGKADACLEALRTHDFVYVHVEAPDEASHARDLAQKITAIEYLDQRLIARVMRDLDQSQPVSIAVLTDHPTPVSKGNHISGPVPVAVLKPGLTADGVSCFDEETVKAGSLGELHRDQFLKTLLAPIA
ncbi:MAG: cofactor-independent phosphoglycerate mutase [candidate division WOR-3 bacterium]